MKPQLKLKSFSLLVLVCIGLAAVIWVALSVRSSAKSSAQTTVRNAVSKPNSDIAAMVGDKQVTVADLENRIKGQLNRIQADEYNIKRKALDDSIARVLLEQEAARRGISADELTRIEIEGKAAQVSQEDKKAEYERVKARFEGNSEAEVMKQVESVLHKRSVRKREQEFVADLRSKASVRILLEAPRLDVSDGDGPSLGPKNASVTIVEFSDFQCPFCARASETLKRVREHFGDKIRIVFRHYPLPIHKDAPKAAEAAICANEQGKFWEMHDHLFASAPKLEIADLQRYAVEIGLNKEQFNQCLSSGKYAKTWALDKTDGTSYGMTGTPSFFINGRIIGGGAPAYDDFVQLIEEELDRAHRS